MQLYCMPPTPPVFTASMIAAKQIIRNSPGNFLEINEELDYVPYYRQHCAVRGLMYTYQVSNPRKYSDDNPNIPFCGDSGATHTGDIDDLRQKYHTKNSTANNIQQNTKNNITLCTN